MVIRSNSIHAGRWTPPGVAANEIELGRKSKNGEAFPEGCSNVGPHLRHFIKSMYQRPSKAPNS